MFACADSKRQTSQKTSPTITLTDTVAFRRPRIESSQLKIKLRHMVCAFTFHFVYRTYYCLLMQPPPNLQGYRRMYTACCETETELY